VCDFRLPLAVFISWDTLFFFTKLQFFLLILLSSVAGRATYFWYTPKVRKSVLKRWQKKSSRKYFLPPLKNLPISSIKLPRNAHVFSIYSLFLCYFITVSPCCCVPLLVRGRTVLVCMDTLFFSPSFFYKDSFCLVSYFFILLILCF